jgi:signal transduction histidine kinase
VTHEEAMITNRFIPKFWDYQDVAAGPFKSLFNFRRIWKQAAFLTAGVALIPLILMAIIDYNVTQDAIESEILLRTSRLVSNTRRSISFFLDERKFALNFIIHDNSFEDLKNPDRLSEILENLKKSLGGFSDIGVIDGSGVQVNYVGPYKLIGVDYSTQAWYREVLARNDYISDVFMGLRNVPHLVVAIKHNLPDGSSFVLRASLDMERFKKILSEQEVAGMGDAFIINHEGILQTPSRYQTRELEKFPLSIPEYSPKTVVYQTLDRDGKILIVGYAYITDTPFILIVTKQKNELMKPWFKTRSQLIGFLAVSISTILIVILGVSTYLVNNIFLSDQKRVMTLHQVEYANKLASIGRLAAGVAHEINNPLAIINEKAGLVKDLLAFRKNYDNESKLNSLIDSIISSVERCGTITKRLLNFARHIEVRVQKISLKSIIQDVLGFLEKEAEFKSIAISVDIPNDIPDFESDRGKLQQIFLNLINNAFAAMADGGRLEIRVSKHSDDAVSIVVKDNGCGISGSDIERIFEPFYTTKSLTGGTGLGLSITYGLVQEIGGKIQVQSAVGQGTLFTIILPLTYGKKIGEEYARIAG